MESKPDKVTIDDLRIVNPFPELLEYARSINMKELDDAQHSHTPYSVILIQLLEQWKAEVRISLLTNLNTLQHNGQIPKTLQEKDQFKLAIRQASRLYGQELNFMEAMNNAFKCFLNPQTLRDSVQELLDDAKIHNGGEKTTYWLLCSALSKFLAQEGALPLSGKLPDMTSTTEFYVTLQNM